MSLFSRNKPEQSQKEIYVHDADGLATKQIHMARTASGYAAFLFPYLRPGQRLLDIGCGRGTITMGLAQAVAPGEVVGIDIEERQATAAGELAKEQGVSNVRYQVGNIYALDFESESFDVIYSNALLEHLHDPVGALKEARRVLKPKGIIGVRAGDMETCKLFPASPMFEDNFDLYFRYRRHLGGDPFLGRKLRALLNQASFENTRFSSSCDESFGHTTESIKAIIDGIVYQFAGPEVREKITELGWADNVYFDRVEHAIRKWSESPDLYCNMVWGEAIGWKP